MINALAAGAVTVYVVHAALGVLGAAAAAALLDSTGAAAALLLGVMVGSAAWFLLRALVAARVGGRLGRRTLWGVDVAAGVGLLSFAGLLSRRTIQDV